MQPVLCLIGITYALIGAAEAQTVTLTSSVEQGGRQAACPGEVISFTCTLAPGVGIRWVAEPFISQNDPIDFAIRTATNGIGQERGDFHAVLNTVTMLSFLHANFTSTLTVRVSNSLDGIVVQCTVPYAGGPLSSSSISIASLPSPPQQLSYSIKTYGHNTFTVTVQWERPTDNEAGNTNYSYAITITNFEPTLLLPDSARAVTLTLSYSEVHTVGIATHNCVGTSSTSELSIYKVGCGDPIPPNSGTLEHYNSTEEGTKVLYRCNTGLTPKEQMAAVCAPNGSWTPNPADLNCRQLPPAGCEPPGTLLSGVVTYTSIPEGSLVVYHCEQGLLSTEPMIAVCMADGAWEPDLAQLECTNSEQPPALPSPPQQLSYSIETYGQNTFTVTVQWERPTDNEAGNTNYSYAITVTNFEPTLLLPDSARAVTLTLSYSEVHTVGIATHNCVGTSSTSELSIYKVGCGDPIPPNSGTLEHYNSTEEGTKVLYRCNTGLTPKEQMAAVCAPNGSWTPNPADLNCRQLPPDIQKPDEPSTHGLSPRVITVITTTVSGIVSLGVGWMAGVLFYHCITKKPLRRQRWTYQKMHPNESKTDNTGE